MYAGLTFPTFQTYSPDVQQFYDLSYSHTSNACLGSSCVSDYDLGGEGDLFKAPEPILEQPVITTFDLCQQHLNDELLINVFHEYNEILEAELSEVLSNKFPMETDERSFVKESVHPPGEILKSMSSDCLTSMGRIQEPQIEPGFLDVNELELGNVFGMRRAFSDGDIKTLVNGNVDHAQRSSLGQPQLMSDHIIEDRWQKLSRYRNKKTKRNFGKKIKYACRKALADNQPRIKGRFAKTEEIEIWRK
ncbi:hypothetical protein R6Q57_021247 [Mikania cordata]